MEHSENEQHIEDLKHTLHELVDEAEKRVENLEAELVQALVVARMRKAVAKSRSDAAKLTRSTTAAT